MEEKKLAFRLQKTAQILGEKAFAGVKKTAMKTGVRLVKEPESGLLMTVLKDTFDTEFFLGEVLVSEATAELNGIKGYAMVTGDCPVKAQAIACVEAIENNGDKYTAAAKEIKKEVEILEKQADMITKEEFGFISSTRVKFESMRKG
jgi:alpha-D-ribose 1-methylphosphonate 5-triphosphate synthase subunit PhnG